MQIEPAAHTDVEQSAVPHGKPLVDVKAATAAALNEPLEYPTLRLSTTPGDRIVLALDKNLPRAAEITVAIVDVLVRAGVSLDGVSILCPPNESRSHGDDPRRLLDAEAQRRLTLLVHNPDDRRQLAYLAADESGKPIFINRALHEADVILPVACLRDEDAVGYFGIHGSIYPTFSDAATRRRFRGLKQLGNDRVAHRKLTALADHVAWLLGVNFTIQLVPAVGDEVLHILAGQSDAVRRQGYELYHAAWDWPLTRRASLVVACLEGGPARQTWEDLCQALAVAQTAVEDGGAVAICCELAGRPGPAMQHLATAGSRRAALQQVDSRRPVDALLAGQLAQTLEHNKVYLLSGLDSGLVEDLEMIPLKGPEELSKLVRQYRSCLFLSSAPFVKIVPQSGQA